MLPLKAILSSLAVLYGKAFKIWISRLGLIPEKVGERCLGGVSVVTGKACVRYLMFRVCITSGNGIDITLKRDLEVRIASKKNIHGMSITTGVKRGRKNRLNWVQDWFAYVKEPIQPVKIGGKLLFKTFQRILVLRSFNLSLLPHGNLKKALFQPEALPLG